MFFLIPDHMIMIIRLEKMIVAIVFWNVQAVVINVIVNCGIHRRFKTGNK